MPPLAGLHDSTVKKFGSISCLKNPAERGAEGRPASEIE